MIEYVKTQEEYHRKTTFHDELRRLLVEAGVGAGDTIGRARGPGVAPPDPRPTRLLPSSLTSLAIRSPACLDYARDLAEFAVEA